MNGRIAVGLVLGAVLTAAGVFRPPAAGASGLSGWGMDEREERLAAVSLGLMACYAPYDFPRTNDHLGDIFTEIRKTYSNADMGDLESDLALQGFVQVLIWEGLGFRLGLERTVAEPPEMFGSVRGEVEARTSPLNLSYSLVKEFPFRRFRLAVGAGLDQYRWAMDWKIFEIGEDPVEDWGWKGRGTGGHAFVEASAALYGLHVLGGAAYHRGVVKMDLETLPPQTLLIRAVRHYEDDVRTLHVYGGMTFTLF